jgi:AcrR family transcriptional regulator
MTERPDTSNKRDPEGVRRDILRQATAIFAERGLSGTRIDEIAARTTTSKRMIYYYFGDKEGLYKACLEAAYARVRTGEEDQVAGHDDPVEALEHIVGFTFDHHRENPDFIRLVMIENIHHARFLKASEHIRGMNKAAIEALALVIARGQAAGVFREGLDATELHWRISALSFFNVSNRATFGTLYGDEMYSDAGQARLRRGVIETILGSVLKTSVPA